MEKEDRRKRGASMTDSRSYPELESERRPVADVLQELSDVIEAVRGDRDLIRVSGLRGGPEDIGIISIDSLQEDLKRACTELRSFTVAQAKPDYGAEAQFLLDRLDEFDPGEEDAEREYHGHVAPAIARLRSALSSTHSRTAED